MMTSDVLASVERHASAVSAAAVDKARRLCAEHPHVTVETLVESGDPRDVICDAADKVGADLLVMGSHGYGFIQRYQSFSLHYITRSTRIHLDHAKATG
jgi:nucleotide-binding universal stress UspA family protein